MFKRSETDRRRIIIIDVSHLFYKFAFGGAKALSSTIMVDGLPTRVDTTLPAYTIKTVHRWSNGGINPTVVCFDGAGCSRSRKAYFLQNKTGESSSYKEGRETQDSRFYEGINLTMNLLMQGGVTCLKGEGYEADDLIKATVDIAKQKYPDLPIDVITGDADLVPLVDDQVSVFLSSRKLTWAEEKEIEKMHYVQLTPNNYQDYMESLTAFKNLSVPYNTVLLTKCLRGDKSDGVVGYPKFTPTKYNNLINSLVEDGYDLGSLCYYDAPTSQICYRGTEEPVPEDLVESTPKEQMFLKFGEPPCLTRLCEILSDYLDEDIVNHVRFTYLGINLNAAFTGLPDGFNRKPAKLSIEISGYQAAMLQKAVSVVQINLPLM